MKYFLALLSIFAVQYCQAQDLRARIDSYVNSYVQTNDFSGTILITEKGETKYEQSFAYAQHNFKVRNTVSTKFKIGSVSKQFTAAALLLMEEEGLLKTSDSLSRFFPEYPHMGPITLQELLTHTSGVRDIYSLPDFNQLSCQQMSISEVAAALLQSEPEFEPDTRYQYSNGGYALLAAIIEKVSGQSYQVFLKEKLFQPLQMQSTGHALTHEIVPNLAEGYDPTGYDALKTTALLDPELLKGSGSLYSTARDLHIWIQSIKNKSLLSEASYEKFLANYGNNYGMGISVYRSFDQEVFGHDGRLNGYIADYLHYIDGDLSIIILGNLQTGVADFFRRDIAAIVMGKNYESRAKSIPRAPQAFIAKEKILGTYAFGPNFKVYVEDIGGSIQARANEGAYSELIPLKDQRFFSRTLYAYIRFVPDAEGRIHKMLWTNNDGNTFEGMKE